MRSIAGLFGRSPFRPLAENTARVHETVQLVKPLMGALCAGGWGRWPV